MNLRAVSLFLGRLVLVLALALIFPLLCSAAYGEGRATLAFLVSMVSSAAL